MSWDYDDYDQREQDYYDTRCYPDEYDTYEEYKLEHENGGGSYFSAGGGYRSAGNNGVTNRHDGGAGGLGKLVLWFFLLVAGYYTLIIAAIFPPVGVLLFLGLVKVKSWFD